MSNNANSNERVIFFSSIAWYYGDNDFIMRTFDFIARSDTARDLHYLIQILTWLAVKNTAFYKLNAAARFPHWLPYIHVSSTYDKS